MSSPWRLEQSSRTQRSIKFVAGAYKKILQNNKLTMFFPLVLAQRLLHKTPAPSYTFFNLCLILYATLSNDPRAWSIAFTNTLSIMLTFYTTGIFIDATFFQRMSDIHKIPRPLFVLGDICIHLLPAITMLVSIIKHKKQWRAIYKNHPNHIQYAGLYSATLNLCWGIAFEFEPKNVYVPNPPGKWWKIWLASTFFHFISNALLKLPLLELASGPS